RLLPDRRARGRVVAARSVCGILSRPRLSADWDQHFASFETARFSSGAAAGGVSKGPPCISRSSRRRGKVGVAVADGSLEPPWVGKPVPEHRAPIRRFY